MPQDERPLPSKREDGSKETVSNEVIQQMLSHNAKGLELRAQELEHKRERDQAELDLRKDQSERNHELALRSIEAQERFTGSYMAHARKMNLPKFIVGGAGILGLIIITLVSLYLNKEDFARALVEKIAYVSVSLWGGYQWGKNSARRNRPENPTDPDPT